MKPFIRHEITFKAKDHSRSSTISSFIRSPGLSMGDRKIMLHSFSENR